MTFEFYPLSRCFGQDLPYFLIPYFCLFLSFSSLKAWVLLLRTRDLPCLAAYASVVLKKKKKKKKKKIPHAGREASYHVVLCGSRGELFVCPIYLPTYPQEKLIDSAYTPQYRRLTASHRLRPPLASCNFQSYE